MSPFIERTESSGVIFVLCNFTTPGEHVFVISPLKEFQSVRGAAEGLTTSQYLGLLDMFLPPVSQQHIMRHDTVTP